MARNWEKQLQNCRNYHQRTRLKAIMVMGGKCERCGIDDPDVLQFDHVVPILRGKSGVTNKGGPYREIINHGNEDGKFQLLCANCHVKKTRQNKEYLSSDYFSEPEHEEQPTPVTMKVRNLFGGDKDGSGNKVHIQYKKFCEKATS